MSCTKTDQTKTLTITSFPKAIELKGSVVYTSCRLLNPTRLCIWDDKLILYDHTNDFLFKAFRLPGLEYLDSYGTIGNGPDEFQNIDENYLVTTGRYLEVTDRGKLKRLTFQNDKLSIGQEITLPVLESPLNRLQRLNDTLYMIDNLPTDASCEHNLISMNSNRINKKFGQYPEDGLVFNSNVEKFQAYRKYDVSKPGGEKIAVFYNYFNKFKIYDVPGELFRTITLNDIARNEYDTGRPEENPV